MPPTTGPSYLSELQGRPFFNARTRALGYLGVDFGPGSRSAAQLGIKDVRKYVLRGANGDVVGEIGQGDQLFDPLGNYFYNVAGPKLDNKRQPIRGLNADYFTNVSQPTEKERANLLTALGLTSSEGGVSPDVSAQTSSAQSIAQMEASSRESIAAADRAAASELERLREEHAAELERMQEEAAMKRQRLTEAGSLATTA